MNHLKWMGHSSTILEINRDLRNDREGCDVTLVAKDGTSVRAHRFVLSTCSDLLRNALLDVPLGQEATIIIADINGLLLESLLSFIYLGETSSPSRNLSEFLEAINLLGIKSAISFECNSSNLNPSVISAPINGDNLTNTLDAIKTISGLQITQEGLIEEEPNLTSKIEANEVAIGDHHHHHTAAQRDLDFLDVYNDPQKITYSIEHMTGTGGGSEFILTENENTFTLTATHATDTEDNKLANADENVIEEDGAEIIEDDNDADEPNIIGDGYNNAAESIIEMEDTNENIKIEGLITEPEITEVETEKANEDTDLTPEEILEAAKAKMKEKSMKLRREMATKLQEEKAAKKAAFSDMKSRLRPKDPIEIDNLERAAMAVINEGLSLQKAADKFDVSKTVLWRRMRRDPSYTRGGRQRPTLALAYERLKNGDSLKNISNDLHIPVSTLHRHKVRLSAEGRLPKFVQCRRRDTMPKEELHEKLEKAVHACVHEGMSQNHAANIFEISKSTLWRHLRRRVTAAELSVSMENVKSEVVFP